MAKKKTAAKRNAIKSKSSRKVGSAYRQQGAVGRKLKAALKHVSWAAIELEELNPLLQRQFVVGSDIMIARVLLKKGCIVPEHSHINEQITYILNGALKFWIDNREIVVRSGEVLTIPPNMPHKAEAMEDTIDLDVFSPPRADWMTKDDRYLRGK